MNRSLIPVPLYASNTFAYGLYVSRRRVPPHPQPPAQGKQPGTQDGCAGVQRPGALQRGEQPDQRQCVKPREAHIAQTGRQDQHGAAEQNGGIDLPAQAGDHARHDIASVPFYHYTMEV